jgi:hypothetical protein
MYPKIILVPEHAPNVAGTGAPPPQDGGSGEWASGTFEDDDDASSKWECDGCSYLNGNAEQHCYLCGTARPSAASQLRSRLLRRKSSRTMTNFGDSTFLRMYDQISRDQRHGSDLARWLECLPRKVKQKLDDLIAQGKTPEQAAVYLWSDEVNLSYSNLSLQDDAVYKVLQRSIIADKEAQLRSFMYLIRVINNFLVVNPAAEDYVCFRGSAMTPEQVLNLQEGRKYRLRMYAAVSTKREEAEKFLRMKNASVMIQFDIPKGCRNASDIQFLSKYKTEAEILIPPYTAVVCNAVEKRLDGKYHVSLSVCMDNQTEKMDLPVVYA